MSATRGISNKLVLVTGAARGVGFETIKRLLAAGAQPVLADIDGDDAAAAAASLPGSPPSYRLDIADPNSFRHVLDTIECDMGPLDVVVNNAGIMPIGRFDEESDVATANIVGVNLLGTIYGTREAYRRMRPRWSGHIVNVASMAGRIGGAGLGTYSASKFGIYGYTEAVRCEARGSGVEFSVVMPGLIDTRLSAGIQGTGIARAIGPDQVAEAIVKTLLRPRFDVYVPRLNRGIVAAAALLPKTLIDRVIAWTGGDRVVLDAAGSPARAAYENAIAANGDTLNAESTTED